MMRRQVNSLFLIFVSTVFFGCGTNVDSGNNSRNHQESVRPGVKSESTDAQAAAGSCFGTVDVLPVQIKTFCEDIGSEDKVIFAKIYETLCVKKQLANLVYPECGWDGRGGDEERVRFLKILDSTSLDDSSSAKFYYFSAYSLTLPPNEKNFRDVIFEAHGNPQKFDEEYGLPDNTEILPLGAPESVGRETQLRYELKLVGAFKASFEALLRGYTVGDQIEVVWDRALSGKMITMRRHLTISFKLPQDGRNKVLIFEEREVLDQGNHKIARTKLKEFDLRRMEMYYDYSKI